MNNNSRGTITQLGSVLVVKNALVENVVTLFGESSHLLISYTVGESDEVTFVELLRLNINSNTVLMDSSGARICICDIHKGVWISSIFSPVMTRSIPPQSNAFLIIVQTDSPCTLRVVNHEVIMTDIGNSFLYTKDPDNTNNEIIFTLSPSTQIRDKTGTPVTLDALYTGDMVKVIHANIQTASIPPQSPAVYIQLI
ncbi:MAG: hypothetical protein QM793_07890 [Muricomes sp.]